MNQPTGQHLPHIPQPEPQYVDAPTAPANGRPMRTTRGQGGRAQQLEMAGIAVQGTPSHSKKRHVSTEIEGEDINPLAPAVQVRTGQKRPRSTTSANARGASHSASIAPNMNDRAPMNGTVAAGSQFQSAQMGGLAQPTAHSQALSNPYPAPTNSHANAYQHTGLASQFAGSQARGVGGGGMFPSNPAFLSHNTGWSNAPATNPSHMYSQGNLEPRVGSQPLNQGTSHTQHSHQQPGSLNMDSGSSNASLRQPSSSGQAELDIEFTTFRNQTTVGDAVGRNLLSPILETRSEPSDLGDGYLSPAPFRVGVDDESPDSTARRMESILHSAIPAPSFRLY
ncbi:hypothetical protein SISNIDRAFT_490115 [Sistotremastrum niveocremeum HHB9708]|uniref:Uncharacterized protein n=1 Tax=Sistotremastrum niveocremeum HHB9708 TaxID=1314777 RepID=A0A164PAD8_9AGAM|nr:hypothetical protein SISNIDRAFT_490115 [Sistotremastrum niveocremeum HHB9708]